MTPTRWHKVKAILADALEEGDAPAREAFIQQACRGDDELLSEVEAFLAHEANDLDAYASELDEPLEDLQQNSGRRVGAYQLVRELGRGGMGAVWLAQRVDEFQQTVAIKLLKRGTDTDEVLRRFRSEREILARLQHPHIARLLDGGATDDGLPYFVMEYVEGIPITQYARDNQLPVAARLALFLQACEAVSYAHRNLVIHRDLKPANVLVTRTDETKLLDFGIAKLAQESGDSLFAPTMTMQRVMTPEYASPEQLTGDPITTVSDVYSLGIILYELLAGRRPFHSKTRAPNDLARIITREEPERPSAAAETADEAGAINRKLLRGDLDRVVLKALHKDPQRRYGSVNQLSEDIERYLNGLPVRAQPDTASYRISKFVQRHKAGVVTGILLALAFLAGTIETVWQAHRAQVQSRLAERRFNDVRRLAHSVLFDYHDEIAALPGSTKVREHLVKDALEYLDNLSRETSGDVSLLRELGTAYAKIGQVQGNTYYDNLGDSAGAMASYQKSLAIRERLLQANPNDAALRFELSESQEGIGDMLYTNGDLRDGLTSYEAAEKLRTALVADHPQEMSYPLSLARLLGKIGDIKGVQGSSNMGDTTGALASYEHAGKILESLFAADAQNVEVESALADTSRGVGLLADTAGNAATAVEKGRRAVELEKDLVARNANNHHYQLGLLAAEASLRFALIDAGLIDEAIAQSRQVLNDLLQMVAADPKDIHLQRNLGVAYNGLGQDLLRSGDVTGALENHRKALTIAEKILSAAPNNEDNRSDLAFTLRRLGEAEAAANNYEVALTDLRKALAARESTVSAQPTNARAREDVANIHANIGRALVARGDLNDGLSELGKSTSLGEKLAVEEPSNAKRHANLASYWQACGDAQRQLANLPAAHDCYARSVALWDELRDGGHLFPTDAHKPEEVARALAETQETVTR